MSICAIFFPKVLLNCRLALILVAAFQVVSCVFYELFYCFEIFQHAEPSRTTVFCVVTRENFWVTVETETDEIFCSLATNQEVLDG